MRRPFVVLIAVAAVSASVPCARSVAKEKVPPVASVAVGDFDGDGIPDVAVGLPGIKVGKLKEAGVVRVHSGKTGARLGTFPGTQEEESLGGSLAAVGDQDDDGATDLAVGSPWRSSAVVYILSGKTLERIDAIPGGSAKALGEDLAPVGDGSGTTKVDLMIRDAQSMTRYYMTPSGALGRTDRDSYSLISAARWVGDLDGDGSPDFVITDWAKTVGGKSLAGEIRAFSGKRMSGMARGDADPLLWTIGGTARGETLGLFVGRAGDWNDDEKGDLFTLEAGDRKDKTSTWRLRVLSGVDGATLWEHEGHAGDTSVGGVALVPDLNDDDKPDIAIGHPGRNKKAGALEVISGADGTVLWTVDGAKGEMLAEELYPCADANGDGLADLVIVSPGAKIKGKRGNGYVRLVSSTYGATITLINPLSRK